MREEWRPVVGYEGLYEVSNMGNVKSVERMKWNGKSYYKAPERILKAGKDSGGYLQVHLCKDGKIKQCLVHRLVAAAFIENPNNLLCINHKDENPKNNCVQNLEWCSYSYNNTYNDKAKKIGKKVAESRKKPLYSINKVSGLITYWTSAKEAGRVLGIDPSSITKCCKGKLKSSGGFVWYYADTE